MDLVSAAVCRFLLWSTAYAYFPLSAGAGEAAGSVSPKDLNHLNLKHFASLKQDFSA